MGDRGVLKSGSMVVLAAVTGLAMAGLTLTGSPAYAQTPKKQASPFSGFSPDSGKPVDIKSDSLEVHQNEQKAIFQGNVVATQGESTLRSATLTVFYDNQAQKGSDSALGTGDKSKPATKSPKAASEDQPTEEKPVAQDQQGSDGQSSSASGSATQANAIKRLEAEGGVTVTSQDQKATGSRGVFDMKSNTATLTGDVVLTQGPNVIRGKQLVVDLTTGVARVQGGTTGLFVPSSQKKTP